MEAKNYTLITFSLQNFMEYVFMRECNLEKHKMALRMNIESDGTEIKRNTERPLKI